MNQKTLAREYLLLRNQEKQAGTLPFLSVDGSDFPVQMFAGGHDQWRSRGSKPSVHPDSTWLGLEFSPSPGKLETFPWRNASQPACNALLMGQEGA